MYNIRSVFKLVLLLSCHIYYEEPCVSIKTPKPKSLWIEGALEVQVFKACTDFMVAPGTMASFETTFRYAIDSYRSYICIWAI